MTLMELDVLNDSESPELPPEAFKDVHLYIATPCYGGNMMQEYVMSLLGSVFLLHKHSIRCEIRFIGGESLITRGRNHLCSFFMASDATHLLFIDGDIEWKPEDILRLISCNKGVSVGAYPLKMLPQEKDGGKQRYVVNPAKGAKPSIISERQTVYPVLNSGTGFMCINRKVIKKLQEAHPDLHYTTDIDRGLLNSKSASVDTISKCRENLYSLFDTSHNIEDNNHYLSEDYTFCKRWSDIGGNIWLDPEISLTHHGRLGFRPDTTELKKMCDALSGVDF
jgi:hypothetical protein